MVNSATVSLVDLFVLNVIYEIIVLRKLDYVGVLIVIYNLGGR